MRNAPAAALLTVVALAALALGGCHRASEVHLDVTPGVAAYDAPLTARASGLRPGQVVTLRLASTDADGVRWSAERAVRADASGRIPRPRHTTEVLQDSMRPLDARSALFSPPHPWTMQVSIRVHGRVVATRSVRRLQPDELGVTEHHLRVQGDGVEGRLYLPRRTRSGASGVVVLGGTEGGNATGPVSALLAAHGHPAMSVGYFGLPGLPDRLEQVPVEYFAHAVRAFVRHSGVDPGRVFVIGISRGAEPAMLTALTHPGLVHGVVSAVGSSIVRAGFPDSSRAAWTWRGADVPWGAAPETGDPHPTVDTIPIGTFPGPVLLVCGGQDAVWRSCLYANALAEQAADAELLAYPEAGHLVGSLYPYVPSSSAHAPLSSGLLLDAGGSPEANAAGRADVWPRLLEFLDR